MLKNKDFLNTNILNIRYIVIFILIYIKSKNSYIMDSTLKIYFHNPSEKSIKQQLNVTYE